MQSWVRTEKEIHIVIMTEKEWADAKERTTGFCIRSFEQSFCSLNCYGECMNLQMTIPGKKGRENDLHYTIWTWEDLFIVVSSSEYLNGLLKELIEKVDVQLSGQNERHYVSQLLESWFQLLLKEDLNYLQKQELHISKMEELILEGKCPEFNSKMLPIKKQLARFFRYYNQLLSLGQELSSEQMAFFGNEDMKWLERLHDRCNLLAQETQFTREYIMQVQEVYQSEIEIRQNDVMKALTMVTTICFPLSLIAGWYGMNFRYMPEIYSVYGYPIVIAVSILIVVVSLIIFKKKKFW